MEKALEKALEGVKKGFIINDELVENPNGNFYVFDDADALKAFFDTIPAAE